jgi:phage terminase large subunit GpA-like protein
LVTRIVKGYRRPEWQKTRDRNEALDAKVYSIAAAAVYGMDRFTDTVWQTLEERMAEMSKQVGQPVRPAQPPRPPKRPIRGRWIDNYGGGGYRW